MGIKVRVTLMLVLYFERGCRTLSTGVRKADMCRVFALVLCTVGVCLAHAARYVFLGSI